MPQPTKTERSRPPRLTAAAVVLLAVSLLVISASASATRHPYWRVAHGAWTNPVGACVGDVEILNPDGDFRCSGTSTWSGTFKGTTTWRVTGNQDPTTLKITGHIDETFRGSVHGRHGKLIFVERLRQNAAGHIVIKGHVVASTRRLRHTRARLTWTGTSSATTGAGEGRYRGRWHKPAPAPR